MGPVILGIFHQHKRHLYSTLNGLHIRLDTYGAKVSFPIQSFLTLQDGDGYLSIQFGSRIGQTFQKQQRFAMNWYIAAAKSHADTTADAKMLS